jgi:hypothetical protein
MSKQAFESPMKNVPLKGDTSVTPEAGKANQYYGEALAVNLPESVPGMGQPLTGTPKKF